MKPKKAMFIGAVYIPLAILFILWFAIKNTFITSSEESAALATWMQADVALFAAVGAFFIYRFQRLDSETDRLRDDAIKSLALAGDLCAPIMLLNFHTNITMLTLPKSYDKKRDEMSFDFF